ncbi:hypothetical protein HDU91_000064, partial [Kappamyces sp. JEL0680]
MRTAQPQTRPNLPAAPVPMNPALNQFQSQVLQQSQAIGKLPPDMLAQYLKAQTNQVRPSNLTQQYNQQALAQQAVVQQQQNLALLATIKEIIAKSSQMYQQLTAVTQIDASIARQLGDIAARQPPRNITKQNITPIEKAQVREC